MKLDLLILSVHPDDAELGCSGTVFSHIAQGKKVGIVDFTEGELGTRGTPQLRKQEAEAASQILGIHARENLGLADGFFQNDRASQLAVITAIRRYQPEIVLANAVHDRHSDHGRASALATDACFLSGLAKISTYGLENELQQPWRPKAVYHFIQDRYITPDLVVDISAYWDQKVAAIKAYKSQFFDAESTEPLTHISNPDFMNFIEARALEFGHAIGVKYGEGFTKERFIGIKNLFDLI